MESSEEQIIDKISLTEEQEEVLNSFEIPNTVDVDIKTESKDELDQKEDVQQMNEAFGIARKIYEGVLAPQLEQNEGLKRKQKEKLMNKLFEILKLQFWFTYIYVLILVLAVLFSGILGISENLVLNVIKFAEFYITSVVAELIAILFFIVKSVFDKSIVELIKDFDKRDNDKNDKSD